MNTSFKWAASVRRVIIGALAAATALLAACSALRLSYNQAPTIAYWWLDSYVDFNDTQSARFRQDLAQWFEWHRRGQLPDYAQLLARARAEVLEPVTPAQLCEWNQEGMRRLDAAFEHAVPALGDLALSLTPEQLQNIERRYAKNNAEAVKEHLPPKPEDRLKVAVKRAEERAKTVYGRLNDAQRERLARGVAGAPIDAAAWIDERKARQQDILRTLNRLQPVAAAADKAPAEKAKAREEAQAGMRALMAHWHRSPREPYRALQQKAVDYNCALAADVHNLSTPAQRQAAAEKFMGWEDDLRALIAQR